MLRAALAFFVLALVALTISATGVAGLTIESGRSLLIIFLTLGAVSLIAALASNPTSSLLR